MGGFTKIRGGIKGRMKALIRNHTTIPLYHVSLIDTNPLLCRTTRTPRIAC